MLFPVETDVLLQGGLARWLLVAALGVLVSGGCGHVHIHALARLALALRLGLALAFGLSLCLLALAERGRDIGKAQGVQALA